ncbi:MAG: hypothetical protein IJZ16_05335 [Clostridia bacterium]|nr:hypothetical protein [Clostridia bacterium]
MSKLQKNETIIQFIKNFSMGVGVAILESVSFVPLCNLFEKLGIDETLVIAVANVTSIVILFFVRLFINYYWVFHCKKNMFKIIIPFALLIAAYTWVTTELIELLIEVFYNSPDIVSLLGDNIVKLIAKFVVSFFIGIINFVICKKYIFNDKKENENMEAK